MELMRSRTISTYVFIYVPNHILFSLTSERGHTHTIVLDTKTTFVHNDYLISEVGTYLSSFFISVGRVIRPHRFRNFGLISEIRQLDGVINVTSFRIVARA